MHQISVVLLALNSGESMTTLCLDRPPCCLPVLNVPLLCRSVEGLKDLDVAQPIHIVTQAHFMDVLRSQLTHYFGASSECQLWQLFPTPHSEHESLAALLQLEKHIQNDVMVATAETVLRMIDLRAVAEHFYRTSSTMCAILRQVNVSTEHASDRTAKGKAGGLHRASNTKTDAGSEAQGLSFSVDENTPAGAHGTTRNPSSGNSRSSANRKPPLFIALEMDCKEKQLTQRQKEGKGNHAQGELESISTTVQRLRYWNRSRLQRLTLQTDFLMLHPNVSITARLENVKVYFMRRWVLKWLVQPRGKHAPVLESLEDVMHELVLMQNSLSSRSHGTLLPPATAMPALDPPRPWYHYNSIQNDRIITSEDLLQFSHHQREDFYHPLDQIRCHSYVIPASSTVEEITTYASYALASNRLRSTFEIASTEDFHLALGGRVDGIIERCYLAKSVQLKGECTIKQSVIGANTQVGDKCRIINCVVMDHVIIEPYCKITNCIIGAQVRIPANSVLSDCIIGYKASLQQEGMKAKGEHFLPSSV